MSEPKMIHRVHQVAFHRNGIGGAGFHAVRFEHKQKVCAQCGESTGWTDGNGKRIGCLDHREAAEVERTLQMLGIVFDEPHHVAVLDTGCINDIAFGANSWRGDKFEKELRHAIETHDSDGSVRVGPFAIPTMRRGESP